MAGGIVCIGIMHHAVFTWRKPANPLNQLLEAIGLGKHYWVMVLVEDWHQFIFLRSPIHQDYAKVVGIFICQNHK